MHGICVFLKKKYGINFLRLFYLIVLILIGLIGTLVFKESVFSLLFYVEFEFVWSKVILVFYWCVLSWVVLDIDFSGKLWFF